MRWARQLGQMRKWCRSSHGCLPDTLTHCPLLTAHPSVAHSLCLVGNARSCKRTHACAHAHTHGACAHTRMRTRAHKHKHTHTHIHTYTHIHTHAQPPPRKHDHEATKFAADSAPIDYHKPDGKLTFDVATSLYRSGGWQGRVQTARVPWAPACSPFVPLGPWFEEGPQSLRWRSPKCQPHGCGRELAVIKLPSSATLSPARRHQPQARPALPPEAQGRSPWCSVAAITPSH